MTNLIAIAPKEGRIEPYLTNGKEYPIISIDKKEDGSHEVFGGRGRGFYITDDEGYKLTCLEFGDLHIGRYDWTIIEQP